MKKTIRSAFGLSLLALATWSCNDKDPQTQPYTSGVMVLNAGNFTDNNGTISFVSRNGSTASYDLFNQVNQRSLTGSVQGYTESDGKGLILVDNTTAGQDKIEIVDASTFQAIATLRSPDIENPRSAVRVSANKVYVSCWDVSGDYSNGTFYKDPGYIAVVDLTTNSVTKKIPAVKGVENLVVANNEVYAGSTGGSTKITILDPSTDQIKQQVDIGNNPSPIAVDANGKLWIYSGGSMVRFNVQSKAIETRLKIGSSTAKSPSLFRISPDKQTFYFVYSFYDPADNYKAKGETYRFSVNDASVPATSAFVNRLFSGLDVDPQTGVLYGGYTPSYKQAGYVFRYQPNGTLIDSVKAEIAPSGFYFK